MSWAEFLIRSHGYNRMKLERLKSLRSLGYSTLVAPHIDPKKLPKNEKRYMPLPGDETGVSDVTKDRFAQAYKEYLLKKNGSLNS